MPISVPDIAYPAHRPIAPYAMSVHHLVPFLARYTEAQCSTYYVARVYNHVTVYPSLPVPDIAEPYFRTRHRVSST
eukprot:190633-Rhodomonas_salina.4